MDTLQAEIDKLTKRHEQEIQTLKQQAAILETLYPIIAAYDRPSIHVSPLYGRVGLIEFDATNPLPVRKPGSRMADADLLRALLAAYPPMPKVKVKSRGSVSIRPDFGESYAEDEYECAGVTVNVETMHTPAAVVEWFATVDRATWEFAVKVPFHLTDFGVLDMIAKRYGGQGPIARWERCDLRANHNAQVIRWASPAPEYPSAFTLYWDRDTGARLDWPSITFARGTK